ncbi:MAG TPA: GNAT family N-acetyltransferase [Vitreimonas sp.]|nr:GNAT family N-acetyltransferase [Vitreimonas sp.]
MRTVEFAPITPEDVPEFTQVLVTVWQSLQHLYKEAAKKEEAAELTEAVIKEKLVSGSYLLIAGKLEGNIVAARVAKFDSGTLYLHLTGVLEIHQGQGIGRQMHEFTFEHLRQHYPHIHKVWCDTNVKNEGGIVILEKLGFTKEAELKNHWHGDDYYLWGYWLK